MVATLRHGAVTRNALSVRVKDSTTAFATFDLRGMKTGVYNLAISSGKHHDTLVKAFTVNGGPPGHLARYLWWRIAALRVRWELDGTTNTGQSDVDVPVVSVKNVHNASIAAPGKSSFKAEAEVLDPNFSTPTTGPLPRGVLGPGQTAVITFGVLSTTTSPMPA